MSGFPIVQLYLEEQKPNISKCIDKNSDEMCMFYSVYTWGNGLGGGGV